MGMDKSGQQTIAVSTWVKLLTFTVRSGYPSTVITTSDLVMDVTGTGNIRFRGSYTVIGGTQQFRVVKNGVTVLGSAANSTVTTTISAQTVAAGDTLELQAFTSASFANTVDTGSTLTFLEYNQTSQNLTLSASQVNNWTATASLSQGGPIGGTTAVGWNRSAALSQGGPIGGATAIGWNSSGGLYQSQHYNIGGTSVIGWSASADLLHISAISTPLSFFSFTDVSVSVHTADGRVIGDFPCNNIQSFNWGRESVEVSTCSFDVLTESDPDLVEELLPWVHWVTIWHNNEPGWTGPIQSAKLGRDITSISARDPSTFMWRTRVPITRTFTDTSPARIADVVWRLMYQLHGIHAVPTVLPGVADDTFTVSAVGDQRMLHQFMDELVKVGLKWTVVAGRPVLGEFTQDPVAELAQCDFRTEFERRRDGTATFNDVRVQGQNWAQTAIVDLAGLHLQTLVSMDDMFGAGNIQRATQQYARDSATIRDALYVPPNASLHEQAPITLNDLIPGKTFIVHGDNASQLMRLDQVNVTGSPESIDVQVTLIAVQKPGELALLTGTTTG
jgi:hypothetical protein